MWVELKYKEKCVNCGTVYVFIFVQFKCFFPQFKGKPIKNVCWATKKRQSLAQCQGF